MIKIIKRKQIADQFQIEVEFKLFGGSPVLDIQNRKTEAGIAAYWADIKHTVLLLNFERFIQAAKDLSVGEPKDSYIAAMERLSAANKYFAENQPTTTKTCEMILKIQRHLMSVMPSTKHEEYDRMLSHMNEIISFCKKEVKDESDILSNT